jgi:hypothetical protein
MTTLTPHDVIVWSKNRLLQAQSAFAYRPSSLNWNETLLNMLIWQQVEHTFLRSGVRPAYDLCSALAELEPEEWGDAICQHAIGESIDDALKHFAVV